MSKSKSIIYPPGEILNPIMGKTDYEYIILWMLSNNEICEWSDFTTEISESTLSGHLKRLINKSYVEKPDKGKYLITLQGKDRFNELSYDKKSGKRKLKYPPKVILKRRNYDHWILWMVYNNYACKWSDFKQEPLLINQSSLSNNINSLIENGFIIRENKEYMITPDGKTEYFTISKQYDLDRQSILEQESRRIEEITEKTREFFKEYNIEDDELKFRYLDHVLKLNYSKVKTMLKNEEDFNKILLFLSINHPSQYPKYISPEDFSKKYDIDATTLNYYIREIVNNQFFQIKFFKIEDKQNKKFYFQKGEPIEKMFNAIVEKYITKFTYLNKFQENPTMEIDLLLKNIIDDICGNIFKESLKASLKIFLPEYIKYLAYKIEVDKKLVDNEAKLEGFVWQNIFEEFQTFEPSSQAVGIIEDDEPFYSIDKQIFDVLDIAYLSKLNFLKSNEIKDAYNLEREENFTRIEKLLYRDKIPKAKELYESTEYELTEINQLILKDIIATAENKYEDSINITADILKKYPKDFVGYLLQSLTYFLMDDYENSLRLIDEGLKIAPNILLVCQKAQVLSKMREWEDALNVIENKLITQPHNILLLRIQFWININEWFYGIKNPEKTLEIIDSAIKLEPNNKELQILKSLFYCKIDRFREAKRFLIKEVEINILKKNPKIDPSIHFILASSYIARGKFNKAIRIASQILELYPNHPISYFTKAIILGYNLIYKFKVQNSNIDNFLKVIQNALSQDPIKSHKTKYLNFQGYVLNEITDYQKAFDTIDKAIEILPNQVYQYVVKVSFLRSSKNYNEALELIEENVKKYPKFKRALYYQKSIIFWDNKQYEESYKVINELAGIYPKDPDIINNKAQILARLKKKEEAIKTAEYQITIDPDHGNPYDTYGEVLQMFGEYKEAIKKYEEALKIEPTGWFIDQTFIKMGLCYEELGMYNEALESYKTAKVLEERKTPTHRNFYGYRADKKISDLKVKMNKSKKNEKKK